MEQNAIDENVASLFFTTTTGSVFEYRLSKSSGASLEATESQQWVNHLHPNHAKVARGIRGVQLQPGRMIFPLDDGRLAELHMSSTGGEHLGPTQQLNLRRKAVHKYEWSVLDAPESEGWNAEYCTEKSGPVNCIAGSRVEIGDDMVEELSTQIITRRRSIRSDQHYLPVTTHTTSKPESSDILNMSTRKAHFCMRAMHTERSFFLISDNGQTFEYQHDLSAHYNTGMWLRHDYQTEMKGALGNYNGSMFLVDTYGNLLIRERNGNDLSWINCTSMRRGRHVATGSPWDGMPGRDLKVTADDALFFVSKKGKLLQFTVALQKYKWKDCQRPSTTPISHIIDHGTLRATLVFAVGTNGRLYQYNTVTSLWHEHHQSPHLILSPAPGAAIRPSEYSLTGSLFMASEDGGLVEYRWSGYEGWSWVEHGTPARGVALAAPPGPCFEGWEVFVVGTDGGVYRRHLKEGVWKWDDVEYPHKGNVEAAADEEAESSTDEEGDVGDADGDGDSDGRTCNRKVAAVKPIPFSKDAVIFQLRDGRLAELRRLEDDAGAEWGWSRIIGAPGTSCPTDYWTAVAS